MSPQIERKDSHGMLQITLFKREEKQKENKKKKEKGKRNTSEKIKNRKIISLSPFLYSVHVIIFFLPLTATQAHAKLE